MAPDIAVVQLYIEVLKPFVFIQQKNKAKRIIEKNRNNEKEINKMEIKHIFSTLLSATVLVASMASCQVDEEINGMGSSPLTVVYCMPCDTDSTLVNVSLSQPFGDYKPQDKMPAGLEVSYSVNGQQRKASFLKAGEQYVGSDQLPYWLFKVAGTHRPGDQVEVAVSADGLGRATASTVIPDKPVMEGCTITPIKKIYNEYDRIALTFKDNPNTEDFYAVSVQKMNIIYGGDTVYSDKAIDPTADPVFGFHSDLDDMFDYDNDFFANVVIFDDKAIGSPEYTLHLDIDRYEEHDNVRRRYFKVRLYHVTGDFYRFFKAINDRDNNGLGEMGFSDFQMSSSNVSGGFGLVGGWSHADTEWTK